MRIRGESKIPFKSLSGVIRLQTISKRTGSIIEKKAAPETTESGRVTSRVIRTQDKQG